MAVEDFFLPLTGNWHRQMNPSGRGDWSEEKWIWQLLKQTSFVCTSVALAVVSFFPLIRPTELFFISYVARQLADVYQKKQTKKNRGTLWAMKAAAVIFLGDATFMKPNNDSVVSGRFSFLPLISECVCVHGGVTPFPPTPPSSLHLHLWASCLCHSATPLKSSPLFLFVPSQRSHLTVWLPVFPTQISSHNISTLCVPPPFPPSIHTPNPTLLHCLPTHSHSPSYSLKTLCGVLCVWGKLFKVYFKAPSPE